MRDVIEHHRDDPLETCITLSLSSKVEDLVLCESAMRLEGEGYLSRHRFEELGIGKPNPNPSCETPHQVEQKPLPSYLRYPYLGESSTFPIIVASCSNDA